MATFTASDQLATPRAIHAGVNVVRTTYTQNGATFSASDILLVAKIPHGATIFDGYICGVNGTAATVFKFGVGSVGGGESVLGAAITVSNTAQVRRLEFAALPFRVSVSDDAAQQWAWAYLTHNSGTITATGSFQFVLQYFMP